MKLTKKSETEILKAYHAYWDAYLKGDVKTMSYWLHDDVQMIGSGRGAFFKNKKETIKYYKSTAALVAGKADMRKRKISVMPVGDQVLVSEECDFFVLIDSVWTFYEQGRISTLFVKTIKGWKIIEEHGFMPDARTAGGEQVNTAKIKAENIRLKNAVKRRTTELEEKNHELKIEASLERVRSRTMEMHKTSELQEVIHVVLKELLHLNLSIDGGSFVVINADVDPELRCWGSGGTANTSEEILVPDFNMPFCTNLIKGVKSGPGFFTEEFSQQEKKKYFTKLFKHKPWSDISNEQKKDTLSSPGGYTRSVAVSKHTSIFIINHQGKKFTDTENDILKRFAKVFEQTYTRFLDLQKAEAQARESQIQLALERVRARTMAMQKSEELQETSAILFEQMKALGEPVDQLSIGIINEVENVVEISATLNGKEFQQNFRHSSDEPLVMNKVVKAWKCQQKSITIKQSTKELEDYNKFRNELTGSVKFPTKLKPGDRRILYVAFFSKGMLGLSTPDERPKESLELLERFAGVFDLTYTRFLDLKNAEAQAREAQIQLALERVRARTMAMFKSDELAETARVLFSEFKKLNTVTDAGIPDRAFISIVNEKKGVVEFWITALDGSEINRMFEGSIKEPIVFSKAYKAWKNKEKSLVVDVYGKSLIKYLDYLKSIDFPVNEKLYDLHRVNSVAFFSKGFIGITSLKILPAESIQLMEKFAAVFEQTYTRFLDLRKAEAQAREADIELGLERVRAKAMAMQRTEELATLIGTVFTELTRLDLALTRCTIWIFNTETNGATWWMANSEDAQNPISCDLPYNTNERYLVFLEHWAKRTNKFQYELSGAIKKDWDDYLFNKTGLARLPKVVIEGMKAPERVFFTTSFNNFGAINAATLEPLSNDHVDILLRFAKVFEQTYTRFLDLQKAEAQAREAQIQLALERVRAKTMAMQKQIELSGVLNLLVEQLVKLGVQLEVANFSNGIPGGDWDLWIEVVTDDGTIYNNYVHFPRIDHPYFRHVEKNIEIFRNGGADFFKDVFSKEEKDSWQNYINTQTIFKDITPQEHRQLIYDKTGYTWSMIFLKDTWVSICRFNTIPFSDEEDKLLRRFANAFNLAYTRFLDLQKAEAQAREAQIEAALERVRSRAMAMHVSNELKEVAKEMRNQLHLLGQKELETCAIHLWDESSDQLEAWAALRSPDNTGKIIESESKFKIKGIEILEENFQQYRSGKKDYVLINDVAKAKEFFKALKPVDPKAYAFLSPTIKNKKPQDISAYWSVSDFIGGSLVMVTMNPPEENSRALLRRFADVFGLAYRRFSDLQKAEAQAREAQIEAALEKVRSGSLAMHRSDELQTVVNIVIERLKELNIVLDTTNILIFNDKEKIIEYWTGSNSTGTQLSASWKVPYANFLYYKAIRKARENKEEIFTGYYSFEEKRKMFNYLFEETDFRNLSPERKKFILDSPRATIVSAIVNDVAIQVISYSRVSFATDEIEIVKRFAKVFNQAYTRFLDLQKAEAQAKEAQIQLALERVRARTMAMQKSDELGEAATLLFQQVKSLGIETYSSGFTVWENNDSELISWMCNADGSINPPFRMPAKEIEWHRQQYESWKKKEDFIIHDFTSKEMKNHYKYLRSFPLLDKAFKKSEAASVATPERQVHNAFNFSKGNLLFITLHPVPESYEIFKRFAKVFEQTYTRFLDLQKAEAQAKEAQIQLALERVRARTMAMQRSDELPLAANLLFQQIQTLGITAWSAGYNIWDDDKKGITAWMSSKGVLLPPFHAPLTEEPVFMNFREAYQRKETLFVEEVSGETLIKHYEYMLTLPGVENNAKKIMDAGFELPKSQINHCAFFQQGFLLFITYQPVPESYDIFKRFAKVFEQTYTRFLDLQKSEAQARESQIQLALERVRASTMAMQRSDDMNQTASEMFKQIQALGIQPWACGFNIFDEDEKAVTQYMSLADGGISPPFRTPLTEDPFFINIYDARQGRDELLVMESSGKSLAETYRYMFSLPGSKEIFGDLENSGFEMPKFQITHCAYFSQGYLVFITYEQVSRAHDIFKRFAKVFEQTYTRFLDLQKAESQTREAQIQLALERVRARTMAMQKSDELQEAATILFQQMQTLSMPAWSAGYCIWNEDKSAVTLWMSSEGVLQPPFTVPTTEDELFIQMRKGQKEGKTFHVVEMGGEKLVAHYKYMRTLPVVGKILDSIINEGHPLPTFQIMHQAYFSQGFLLFITYEPVPEAHEIFKRFAKVFEQTYTRFLDLQKAEAQAKEAQIEAALEKVRSRTMAMQKSEELKDVINLVYEQLIHLNIHVEHAGFLIDYKTRDDLHIWLADEHLAPSEVIIPWFDSIPNNSIRDAKEKGDDFFFYHLSFEEKNKFYRNLFKLIPGIPEETINYYLHCEGLAGSGVLLESIGLYIENFSGTDYTDEENAVLMRFGKVFQQTYTRFLDLEKAEAQAREAQIEAALERVRSKAMAMHSSEDVTSATVTMFTELEKLGIENFRCGITNIKKDRTQEVWSVTNISDEKTIIASGIFNMDEHPFWKLTYKTWIDKKDSLYYFLAGKEKDDYVQIINRTPHYLSKPIKEFPDVNYQVYFFGEGAVWTMSLQPHSEEVKQVMKRFASVFSLTFRRYKDLQKAEAQARESQIETALERVRARTMAMQKSSELNPTADLLFEQLRLLGAELQGVAFAICDKDSDIVQKWTSIGVFSFSSSIEPAEQNMYEAWKNKIPLYEEVFEGERIKKYYETLMEVPSFKQGLQQLIDAGIPMPTWQKNHAVSFQQGYLLIITTKPYAETQIFLRFGKVFEQTYTRFLDLQKAEAQARESQIEAAMEKVRARALAMQKADELIEVAQVLRNEMGLLGVEELETSSIYTHNEETGKTECWYAIKDEKKLVADHMMMDLNDTWVGREMLAFYHSDKKHISIPMRGENRKEWINYCSEKSTLLQGFYGETIPDRTYHLYKFSNGYMGAASPGDISSESWNLLQRATAVFSLAYTRFSDLQQTEAAAKETVKQAALDRIRADIASMRTISDLDRITPLIWNELTILGIPFNRCGVFIMDDEKELIHTFLSTPDGKAIAAVHIPYTTPGKIELIPHNWRKKLAYTDHWNDEDFNDFANALLQQHAIASTDQYLSGVPHGGFFLHFVPFLQGMLYAGNAKRLTEDEINTIQIVADTFSTAYARYEDFNKLEAAKKRVDSTLSELQATQKQLIQSEKMASLGELTAGIAHEIQNPLNFVNNFSEVSNELIEELRTCLAGRQVKNYELKIEDPEINELLNDIRQNLEKINHHGKRADAIVKGMLQHSQKSTGQKELTDINALCDEYLRLSYHGMRAKDKNFNCEMKTDYDERIGKINIVPQDIGRVILNLINNAFYAVNEKKKLLANSYQPLAEIKTRKLNDKVEIIVSDNGNGIPDKIKDKIFQPFFTTKPTGSGTGLGLSLSYDIVKAHGGEIRVESKEGKASHDDTVGRGTKFIIILPSEQ